MKSLDTRKLQKDLLHNMLTKKECCRFEVLYEENKCIIGSPYGLYFIDIDDKFVDFKNFDRPNYKYMANIPFNLEDRQIYDILNDYHYLCDNIQTVKYNDRYYVMFNNLNTEFIQARLLVDYNFVKYFNKDKCNFYFKDKTSPLFVVDLETEKLIGYIMPIRYDGHELVHMKPINDKF